MPDPEGLHNEAFCSENLEDAARLAIEVNLMWPLQEFRRNGHFPGFFLDALF